jgi:thioredoxin-dependent peroxiredoxin
MTKIMVGEPIPHFALPATDNKTMNLSQLRGKHVVLYFYPKDDTPGCTLEGQSFCGKQKEFAQLNTMIIGVSRDTVASHEKFKKKYNLSLDLLSDANQELCKLFDVIKEKNMYGKKVMGIERSTFLIDNQGILRHEWRKVKVDGHVEEVLDVLQKFAE